MSNASKMVGLPLIGFLLVACTIGSAQPAKDKKDDVRTEKGKMEAKGKVSPRPEPGKILSAFVVAQLKLTDDQLKKLTKLQLEVDDKLGYILTEEQQKQLKEIQERVARGGQPGGGGKDREEMKKDFKKDPAKDDKKDPNKDE